MVGHGDEEGVLEVVVELSLSSGGPTHRSFQCLVIVGWEGGAARSALCVRTDTQRNLCAEMSRRVPSYLPF